MFHRGINEKPQRQGRMSAGVMIILRQDLTRSWTQAGKLKLIIPPHLQISSSNNRNYP